MTEDCLHIDTIINYSNLTTNGTLFVEVLCNDCVATAKVVLLASDIEAAFNPLDWEGD
jgi:hypothetical protein